MTTIQSGKERDNIPITRDEAMWAINHVARIATAGNTHGTINIFKQVSLCSQYMKPF